MHEIRDEVIIRDALNLFMVNSKDIRIASVDMFGVSLLFGLTKLF